MHFADEDVDTSKYLIAQVPVEIDGCETQKEMKARVNQMEHQIQWIVTKAIIE
jgi:folate-dependent phosphoribosylglycinamide formyltransferase PurN